ncbi:hypothetical protein D3C81_1511490 [compost metagenome]
MVDYCASQCTTFSTFKIKSRHKEEAVSKIGINETIAIGNIFTQVGLTVFNVSIEQ